MQLTSDDLFSALSMLALWLLIAGLVVAFSIARARRRGSTTLALDVTRNASYVFLALSCAAVILSAFAILGSTSVSLDGAARDRMAMMREYLLSPVCEDPGDSRGIVWSCGATVEGVALEPRLLIYAGAVLMIVAGGAVAWAIYNATRRAGEREPFHRSVAKTFGVVAIVVMVTVVVGQLLQQIGMTLAVRSLEWQAGVEVPFELSIPLWPFAVAVGLFALSAIFRYGAVLQRETEGLV